MRWQQTEAPIATKRGVMTVQAWRNKRAPGLLVTEMVEGDRERLGRWSVTHENSGWFIPRAYANELADCQQLALLLCDVFDWTRPPGAIQDAMKGNGDDRDALLGIIGTFAGEYFA